jgi:small subunit ribosomal protein S1
MPHRDESEDFAALLAEYDGGHRDPAVGDKVTGTIVSIGEEVAFVDTGGRSEGVVAREELEGEDGALTVAVGDSVEAMVSAVDASGNLTLRVRPGRGEASRSELRLAWQQKLPVEGVVSAVVKGGVEVTVAGQRAFCPISQLADRFVEDAAEFVDRRLTFRVQRYEEAGRRANVVLSRRALLEEEKERQAEKVRERLELGAVLEGTVSSITSYGAFVDLGGLEGLLHVSELSHRRIEDPRELLTEGQKIEVKVLKVEAGEGGKSERISLSTRALEQDPWHDAERRFAAGTVASGRVTRLETYGAFVELAPGVEGLAHVSRLGREEHVRHAREVVQLGQDVEVEVLDLDLEKRRIALALKVAAPEDETAAEVESYRRASAEPDGFGSLASFFKKSS